MGKSSVAGHKAPLCNWRQRLLLLLYAALFGGVLPFICWGALGMPGHPHAGPHFVFLPPPQQHTSLTNNAAAPIMAMNAARHMAAQMYQPRQADCTLAAYGGSVGIGIHKLRRDSGPVGQAYPSLLAVTLVLLLGQALAVVASFADRHGFRCWLAALLPSAVDLRIPTPPPRLSPFPA